MRIPRLFFVIMFLFFESCSSPLSKKYNPETFAEDLQAIRESNKLTEEEQEMLVNYLLMSRLGGRLHEEQTYQEILDEAKTLKHADAELSKLSLESRDKAKRLDTVVKVDVVDKNLTSEKGTKNIVFGLSVQNKKSKEIRKLQGTLFILDENNVELRSVNVEITESIKPNATTRIPQLLQYGENIQSDKVLAELPLSKLRFKWISDKITFEDGLVID